MENVKNELAKMNDRELVAYFNILRVPCLGSATANNQPGAHLPIVRELMNGRGLGKVAATAEKKGRMVVLFK